MNRDMWMGLKDDGTQIQISHSRLMDWAYRNDKQITVGWGHSFQHEDQRLVRGEYVKEALKSGWDDLAQMLVKHLGDCPGIHIEGSNFSGCNQSTGDCPTCGK